MLCGVNEASQLKFSPSLWSRLPFKRKASLYTIKKKATGEGYGTVY